MDDLDIRYANNLLGDKNKLVEKANKTKRLFLYVPLPNFHKNINKNKYKYYKVLFP